MFNFTWSFRLYVRKAEDKYKTVKRQKKKLETGGLIYGKISKSVSRKTQQLYIKLCFSWHLVQSERREQAEVVRENWRWCGLYLYVSDRLQHPPGRLHNGYRVFRMKRAADNPPTSSAECIGAICLPPFCVCVGTSCFDVYLLSIILLRQISGFVFMVDKFWHYYKLGWGSLWSPSPWAKQRVSQQNKILRAALYKIPEDKFLLNLFTKLVERDRTSSQNVIWKISDNF